MAGLDIISSTATIANGTDFILFDPLPTCCTIPDITGHLIYFIVVIMGGFVILCISCCIGSACVLCCLLVRRWIKQNRNRNASASIKGLDGKMNTDALEKGFNKKLEGSLSKEECNEQVEQYTSNKDANEQKKEDASKERFHEQVNKVAPAGGEALQSPNAPRPMTVAALDAAMAATQSAHEANAERPALELTELKK